MMMSNVDLSLLHLSSILYSEARGWGKIFPLPKHSQDGYYHNYKNLNTKDNFYIYGVALNL